MGKPGFDQWMMEKLQLEGIFFNLLVLKLGSDKVRVVSSVADLVCPQLLGNRKNTVWGHRS